MKRWFFLLSVFAACLLCGCTAKPQEAQIFAMDTVIDIAVYGSGAQNTLRAVREEISRLDSTLSRHDSASAVSALNRSAGSPAAVDGELYALLQTAVGYTADTDGCFDISVAPVMDAWDFTGDAPRVPSREELDALTARVGSERIRFDGGTVTLPEGMAVDLGGIAKGYASDRIAALLTERGVTSARVSLGGNVYVHGTKPDGTPWRVGVEDPNDPGAFLGVVLLADRFAITSGGYQRYFEQDGVTYYHILDPKTGNVARSGLTSVTILCGSGTMGDAFSTALFVMGLDKAVDFWKTYPVDFDMILADDSGHVYVTEGLRDSFDTSLAEHAYEYIYLTKD